MSEILNKYKPTILSVLAAILSLAVGLSSLDLGVKAGAIIAILIVTIPVFVNLLTEGFNDKTVNLIVNAVSIIQQIFIANNAKVVGNDYLKDLKEVNVEDAVPEPIEEEEAIITPVILTKEEIKEMLLENLK